MDTLHSLIARANQPQTCTDKNICPASLTVYGYQPNLAATLFFLILFALSGVVHLGQGFAKKTWFFSIAMLIGCIAEVVGYISKYMLYQDVFSKVGFKMSIVMLTLAPAFFSAGVYYTLKYITITYGAEFSRLKPAWYTYVFITCDIASIILQGVGGAISSGSNGDDAVLQRGDNIMIAGLALQVVTLVVFGVLAADYAITIYRHRHRLSLGTHTLTSSLRFRLFLLALIVSYTAILIRCSYRVAELAGGWSRDNQILRNQGLFIALDSVPCLLATIVLNIWHPGWCFPKQQQAGREEKDVYYNSSDSFATSQHGKAARARIVAV